MRLFYLVWFVVLSVILWGLAPHLPRLVIALGLGAAVWLVTTADLRRSRP